MLNPPSYRAIWRVPIGLRRSGWAIAALAAMCLWSACAVLDPRQRDPPPPGIARVETVVIDGLPERLLIRGNDPAHQPLLLFLHGGPGFPGAPFRQVNSELERDFTVVHWDQRNAGYSYFPGTPRSTMQVEQFARETIAVTRHLCREFHQPKVYLVGHSWGTLPGALAAARSPQLFYAYIGLCQYVDIDESERRLARLALAYARENHDDARARRLQALGPPPYPSMSAQDRAAGLISSLLPHVPNQATDERLALLALTSRYYPLPELVRVYKSYRFSRSLLDPQLHGYDLRKLVPEIDVPTYFFVGARDATFGVSIQREYYERLIAPRGKSFVLFRDSTHWPHLEQPDDFSREMRLVRAQTWHRRREATPGTGR